jgi:surfeit locus 1 family protein
MQRLWSVRMQFIIVAIAALLSSVLTASLGFWQLSRAKEKISTQATYENRGKMPAVTAHELSSMSLQMYQAGELEAWRYRYAVVEGIWLIDKTVYLDNRQMRGRPGFFVLTPLQLANSSDVVLVQRGWIPRNFQDRNQIVPIETTTKAVRIAGYLAASPARLFEFVGSVEAQGVSRIRQNLDIEAFRQETGLPLLPLSLIQTVADEEIHATGNIPLVNDGVLRDWPVVTSGVDRNYGYAFQWFGLSGLIVLLYVWFQFIRRSRPN